LNTHLTQQTVRRLSVILALVLAIPTIGAVVLARLALGDIYHHEADVTLEWQMVGIAFVMVLAFLASVVYAFRQRSRAKLVGVGTL
jgi:predicted Abi (CAAX) family protease